jgi:molybdate transport system substrate-binding protein
MNRRTIGAGLAFLVLALLALPHAARASEPPHTTLRVFAAASLADAFAEIGRTFERTHPGTAVRLNLAGSQQLAVQLEQGAGADVFASADQRWMDYVRERQLITGDPVVFARNQLVVILPKTNPARIGKLQDLARRGTKMVIAADAVPVGRYSRQVLQNLSNLDGFESSFCGRVLANVVSEEENVKSVLAKVQLGEADAGIVYVSDVTPSLARYLRTLEIPAAAAITAGYPIAVMKDARQPAAAQEFVELVLSAEGQRVLERNRLLPAADVAR